MRIALPLTENDCFSPHFGAATRFIVFETAPGATEVSRRTLIVPPPGGPCHWLPLLRTAGVNVLLTRAMGQAALDRLSGHGFEIVNGLPAGDPEELVHAWLAGALLPGVNRCRGGHSHVHEEGEYDHEHGCGCTH